MKLCRLKQTLGLTLGALVFGCGLIVIQAAWSEPLASAPTCVSGNPGCDAPLYTESDPQVGTLTDTKWCTSNGTAVNCTSDAPTLTESDPQVGTLTSGKICTTDGTAVNCETDLPTSSQWTTNGSDIGYTAGSVGVGTTSPTAPLEVLTTTGWNGLLVHQQSNNDNGAVVNIYKERGTSAASANDWAGGIQYNIKDSAGNFQNIAAIHAKATNVTDGAEAGQLHFFTRNDGTWGDQMIIDQNGNTSIDGSIQSTSYNTNTTYAGSPYFIFQKSHNNTFGTYTTTVSGESAGILDWRGVNSNNAATPLGSIEVVQSAAAGNGSWNTPATMYLNVGSTGGVVAGMTMTASQAYFPANISALSITDRTPYPKDLDTAYTAVQSMKRLPDGEYDENNREMQLDHDAMSAFIKTEEGDRDLSASVSSLNEVMKYLLDHLGGITSSLFVDATSGNVGIGTTTPGEKLDIIDGNGRVASGYSWLTSSDSRYKKNVTTLTSVLNKIVNLRGVRYDLVDDQNSIEGQGKYIGVIAQELETQFPELVVTDSNGYKSVAYDKISAVLLQAINELNEKNASIAADNALLHAELATLEARVAVLEAK